MDENVTHTLRAPTFQCKKCLIYEISVQYNFLTMNNRVLAKRIPFCNPGAMSYVFDGMWEWYITRLR